MRLTLKIVLVVFFLLGITFSGLLYFQVTNRDCLNIPEKEAVEMIDNIFNSKRYNTASDGEIFGNKLSNVDYSLELNRQPDSDKNLGYVELLYKSKASEESVFTAVIYSNCEIQWIKKGI